MIIQDIIAKLEKIAAPALQEDYDNVGLITGNRNWECTGLIVSLDATEPVVEEAIAKGCNLIVAHHPIIFKGLKKINGNNYVEQTIIRAIKNDIAIFAIHTNLDNVIDGVSGRLANQLGLLHQSVLIPKKNMLKMLAVYVPHAQSEKLREALFAAGAGSIGNYTECSFGIEGTGSYKPGDGTNPTIGKIGSRHHEPETKLELIFQHWQENEILQTMKAAHPYEEVAFQVFPITNHLYETGSGIVGELPQPMPETQFLEFLQQTVGVACIKHSPLLHKPIQKVALCGGTGSFGIPDAKASKADIYITADLKYHEYFDAEGQILLADIGHYESEQFTMELLVEVLSKSFPNFAVLKTGVNTNPIHYFNR